MLSKAQIQLAQRLQQKKFRQEEHLFLVEGTKIVEELLSSEYTIHSLFAVADWMQKNSLKPSMAGITCIEVTESELKKISALSTPNEVLCIVQMLKKEFSPDELINKLSIALSDVQDPGNFGTIMRIADWFGIEHVFCSPATVDLYNPKVIQASMGSFLRTKVIYTDLKSLLEVAKNNGMISYGAVLEGENLYSNSLTKNGIIVLGNESKGISQELIAAVEKKIRIPSYAAHPVDSLNVSIAAAIICAEFRR